MAEKMSVEFEADVKGALKDIKSMREEIERLRKAQEETSDSTGKMSKVFGGLGKVFKGAFGLGIILSLFEALKEAFMQNQTTADALAKVGVVLQGVFNALIKVVQPLVETLSNAFTKPQETLQAFKDKLASTRDWLKDQFLERIRDQFLEWGNNLQIGFAKIRKAIFGLFSDESAKKAQTEIDALRKRNDEIQKQQDERNARLKEDYEQVKKSVKETAQVFVETVKSVAEVSDELAFAEDRIAKMEIAQQGLVEKYDLQAESLRQIRDDEFKSLAERMKANNDLLDVLKEQADAEKATIQERIGLLELQQDKLGFTRERENEILALRNELVAVEAKVTGFKSEQLMNDMALKREADEINEIKARGELEIQQLERDGMEERESNEFRKLQMALDRIDREKQAEVDLLKEKQKLYAEDSVAYQDYQAQINMIEAEAGERRKSIEMQVNQAKLDAGLGLIGALKGAFAENAKVTKALGISEALINTYTGATKALSAPFPMNLIQLATTLTTGFAQVKSIMAVDTDPDTAGTSTPAPAPVSPATPNVSIAGGGLGSQSQLLGAIGEQLQRPQRSYVVSTDVSSQQALDRRIVQNATFG